MERCVSISVDQIGLLGIERAGETPRATPLTCSDARRVGLSPRNNTPQLAKPLH